jgi:hypothetical protein
MMTNTSKRSRPDERLDELLLDDRPWSGEVLDKLAFAARSAQ